MKIIDRVIAKFRPTKDRQGQHQSEFDALQYWKERANAYGKSSVINLGHGQDKFENITAWQKEILFPLLKDQLNGSEKTVLDFGCGPGRFTGDLAEIIGECIGVDPIPELLDLAPVHDRVKYIILDNAKIPLRNEAVDVIWCSLVLGGIDEAALPACVKELDRVLQKKGLLFLVENTAEKADAKHWHFRTEPEYAKLFTGYNLKQIGTYDDIGERISVMAGRKA